ncbi:hypothetical protein [Roseospira navarrensis]|uniref:DUF4407 domain-containing protein n=1 Tax=Roseospira navarrensis TaxID=140058 RepID=A0A7X1ZG07_9PROT|nr:hypothetical protein [Roseospira navarrensis]MQX36901.1 hypothetical protein [Roseospira navarrensis]
MARDLKTGISDLATTTSAALGILALASGVYTYIGVKGLLDGSSGLSAAAAVAYAIAVSVGIYVFWTYILRFFPLLRCPRRRAQMTVAMLIGAAAIVAMSSWLNAAALAGSAAVEQHLAETVEDYQETLEAAHEQALAAQGLLPDIRIAAGNFESLADQERRDGTLTGTSGSGTVVQLLTQMAGQLRELEGQIAASREEVASLFAQGTDHLRRMRELVASQGAVEERSIAFSEEAVQVAGLVAELKQTSVAPAVKRAAEDLSRSFIAPAPDGASTDLRQRQAVVVQSVRETIQAQSLALAQAAAEVLDAPTVETPRFTPISTAEAVLIYAEDFIPSWAGAIAIDLLPGVIVFILMIVQSAIRSYEDPLPVEETMTLKDLQAAMTALRRIEAERDRTATPAAAHTEDPAAQPSAAPRPARSAAE